MRPETLHRKVRDAISAWLDNGSADALVLLQPRMERQWRRLAAEEGDYRTGREYHGYRDPHEIRMTMFYISDRFGCAVRYRWILDGLEGGFFEPADSAIGSGAD